ncbi:MAG: energy transducer TonB [Nitrospirae bacterium]|nr:energy transducer TonB [Nitrospirota bacterium]
MKYKLTLMFIFSFIVHITIAGALVYVPYQISINIGKNSTGEVIWGKIQGREGGSKKAEVRSKKLEARSKKSEQGIPTFPGEGQGESQNSLPFKGRVRVGMGLSLDEPVMSEALTKDNENPPLFSRGGMGGSFSDEPNINTGNDGGVLFASSTGGQSHSDEGDEIIKAEKGRIYSEQLKGLIGQVKNEIEKNKYYPFLAKLNGIEGTVYVNFHIGQDGKTGSVAIQKTSGAEILDDSAVKTIKNLKPFRNINPELRELDITVPITYRLRED